MLFEMENVMFEYKVGDKKQVVLRDISLKIQQGQIVCLYGKSGAGKSTLLHVLSGLEVIKSGEMLYKKKNFSFLSERERSKIRLKEFGIVFQDSYMIHSLTVKDNIILPVIANNIKLDLEYFDYLVDSLDIRDLLDKKTFEISGGERQRVAIARALIHKPEVLFADEPTGSLDSVNSKKVFEIMVKLQSELEYTLIYVTHDEDIRKKANRVLYVRDGRVYEK